MPEPWLRGTLVDVPVLTRAVLHALELAGEDIDQWCSGLTDDELNAKLSKSTGDQSPAPMRFFSRRARRRSTSNGRSTK